MRGVRDSGGDDGGGEGYKRAQNGRLGGIKFALKARVKISKDLQNSEQSSDSAWLCCADCFKTIFFLAKVV